MSNAELVRMVLTLVVIGVVLYLAEPAALWRPVTAIAACPAGPDWATV